MLCLMPVLAHAVGFGAPVLSSHLNEPLKVKIALILSGQEPLAEVVVDLATPAEYRMLGLQVYGDRSALRVGIEKGGADGPHILLESTTAVQEPVLSILLKARRGRSTYFKHFQILLDPVHALAAAPVLATTVARVAAPVSSRIDDAAIRPAGGPDSGWSRAAKYGPVRSGDSLSEIAFRLRKDKRYSNRQVMLALYESNPDAFIDGDINRLKSRSWLQIPSALEVEKKSGVRAMQRLQSLVHADAQKKSSGVPEIQPGQEVQTEPATQTESAGASPELQFAGRIAVGQDEAAAAAAMAERDRREQLLMQEIKGLHDLAMGSQLRMDGMHDALATIEPQILSMQVEIAELRASMQENKGAGSGFWMIAFALVLVLNVVILLGVVFRRQIQMFLQQRSRPAPLHAAAEPPVAAGQSTVASSHNVSKFRAAKKAVQPKRDEPEEHGLADTLVVSGPKKVPVHESDDLIRQIEEALYWDRLDGLEEQLDRLDGLSKGNLRGVALRAEYLHKMGLYHERNKLINSLQKSAHEKKWLVFSRILPPDIWQSWQDHQDQPPPKALPEKPPAEAAPKKKLSVLDSLEFDELDTQGFQQVSEQEELNEDGESNEIAARLLDDPFGQTVIIDSKRKLDSTKG